MKIELTIKTDYLPTWGIWEGLRELVQNGLDAEVELGSPLEVSYRNNTVRLENAGAELPYEALLFGHTTKLGRSGLIGKFGEGLKLGLLALVRAGRAVRIRSGSEVWVPSIERSSKFNADVLVINVTGGRTYKKRVRVEIDNVSTAEWGNIKDRFLFLSKPSKSEKISTDEGDLLLGDTYKHRVYVKGIFVHLDSALNYGYNYIDATLDRDRKMVDSWDKKLKNARIWKKAVASRPDLFEAFYTMLSEGSQDIQGVEMFSSDPIPEEVVDQVAAKFTSQFGEDAVPVATLEQSRELEHLGKKGVIADASIRTIMAQKIGTLEAVSKSLREEVVKKYSWHELKPVECGSLTEVVTLVFRGAKNETWKKPDDVLSLIDIVDFRSEKLLGQFKDGRYLLARRLLEDEDELMATLVHEVAHHEGGDGEHGHVAELERIWKGVVRYLRTCLTEGTAWPSEEDDRED